MSRGEVIDFMSQEISENDWNTRCDEVKRRCNGYPAFWYSSIVQSGMMSKTEARWVALSN